MDLFKFWINYLEACRPHLITAIHQLNTQYHIPIEGGFDFFALLTKILLAIIDDKLLFARLAGFVETVLSIFYLIQSGNDRCILSLVCLDLSNVFCLYWKGFIISRKYNTKLDSHLWNKFLSHRKIKIAIHQGWATGGSQNPFFWKISFIFWIVFPF